MSADAPRKALGQHWLTDRAILQSICLSAEVSKGDNVLEVGPGLGTLTAELLAEGAKVTALEYDHELAVSLHDRIEAINDASVASLNVLEGDIRSFDYTTLPVDYKLVANIPYYLTSNLMRALTDTDNKPLVCAILMQKEVAVRIVGGKSKESLLSVIVQFAYECSLGTVVEKEYFTPPPKVDSQVLVMHRRTLPLFAADKKVLYRLFRAGFSEKRKNLRNALSGGLGIDKPAVMQLLDSAGIDYGRRAESLSWAEWESLYGAFCRDYITTAQ